MNPNRKMALVCSSGGHFLQLYSLKDFWGECDHFWITFRNEDTSYLLEKERVYFAFSPTNRNVMNFFRNLFLACKLLLKEKPAFLVTTGAGVSAPFIYMAHLLRIRTVYIESLTRANDLSLTGKLVYPVVTEFIVQWPELAQRYKKAKFAGQVI